MYYMITIVCGGSHTQELIKECGHREEAEMFAQLLDGTFRGYRFPPGPNSSIGKCGICGQQLRSSVKEVRRSFLIYAIERGETEKQLLFNFSESNKDAVPEAINQLKAAGATEIEVKDDYRL